MSAIVRELVGIAVILIPAAVAGGLLSIAADRYIERYERRCRAQCLTNEDIAANSRPLSSAIENGVTR